MKIQNTKLLVFGVLFLCCFSLYSQKFSVLTCGKGEEIYSTFGHSAIRYQDSSLGIDCVYNYGLFEFYDPQFIPKFCMGKLDYMVGKESIDNFMYQYAYEGREVKEQYLHLTKPQSDSLLRYLEWNILPQNKFYRYDFLYNNCATKIIEVLEKNCSGLKFRFENQGDRKSFRQLIHINAENSVPWIDWGMDLALGMPTDKKATDREYCFLPHYVAQSLSLTINTAIQSPLVEKKQTLLKGSSVESQFPFYLSPIFFVLCILGLSIYHKIYDKIWSRWLMGILFFILGIGGVIIGFEWFFTEHSVTKANWNLLWLNPLSLFYAISFIKNKEIRWLKLLLGFCFFICFISIVFHIQRFHFASTVLVFAIYIQLIKWRKKLE